MAIDLFSHMPTHADLERFQKHVEIDPVTGCHNWTGACNKDTGRPYFSVRRSLIERLNCPRGGNKRVLAYNWIYDLAHGEREPGMERDHKCCNVRCVNLEHLQEISREENLALRGRVHLD